MHCQETAGGWAAAPAVLWENRRLTRALMSLLSSHAGCRTRSLPAWSSGVRSWRSPRCSDVPENVGARAGGLRDQTRDPALFCEEVKWAHETSFLNLPVTVRTFHMCVNVAHCETSFPKPKPTWRTLAHVWGYTDWVVWRDWPSVYPCRSLRLRHLWVCCIQTPTD